MKKTPEHKQLEADLKKVRSALGKLGKRHRAETRRLEELHQRNLVTLEISTRTDQRILEAQEARIAKRLGVILGRAGK